MFYNCLSTCYGLHLREAKTGRKAGRLVVVGVSED